MGKIACTKQGAQEFKNLAQTLQQCEREIEEAASTMMSTVSGVGNLGEFKEPIEEAARKVQKTANDSREPINLLTGRINQLAENIEMIVSKYS